MADFNSSLPVRTQTNGDVVAAISDGTINTQLLGIDASGRVTIKLDDGAGNAITSQANGSQQALDVGINVLGVQIDPRDIRALTASDIVTAQQGSAPWSQNLTQVGGASIALGQALMAASLPVVIASNQSAIPVTQSTNPWITSDLADGSISGGAAGSKSQLAGGIYNSSPLTLTNGQQAGMQFDVNGYLKMDLATPIPAGSNAIGSVLANMQVASAPVTSSNPVPVSIVAAIPGTAIQDYHTSASLAPAASTTFTYTVPALSTLSFQRCWASASGKIKIVVAISGSTAFVGFNSTANPNIDITVTSPPQVAAASTVTVTVTNTDLLAQDVYVTIEGNRY